MQKPTGNCLKAPNRAATNIVFNRPINSSVEYDLEDVTKIEKHVGKIPTDWNGLFCPTSINTPRKAVYIINQNWENQQK